VTGPTAREAHSRRYVTMNQSPEFTTTSTIGAGASNHVHLSVVVPIPLFGYYIALFGALIAAIAQASLLTRLTRRIGSDAPDNESAANCWECNR
jgi:hypothetical protein